MNKLFTQAIYCLLSLVVAFFLIDFLSLKSLVLTFLIYAGIFFGFQYGMFRQGAKMKSIFLMSLYAALGYVVFQYIYVYVIDPNYVENLSKMSKESLLSQGHDEEEIDRSMKLMGSIFNSVTIPLWGLAGSLFQLLAGYLVVLFINNLRKKK